jgi:electron transport complex protein RnfA
MELVTLLVGTVLVNNVVLVKFLGLCPLMGVSNKFSTATGMGVATTFVLTLSCITGWLMEHYILAPYGLEFLRIICFILVVAAVVQFTEMMIKKTSPLLHRTLGIFLPLITTNCAVLGVALINISEGFTFIQSIVYGIGASIGFTVVLIMFAGLRERLALSTVPVTFEGTPVALVTAGVLSLIFMGFGGLV